MGQQSVEPGRRRIEGKLDRFIRENLLDESPPEGMDPLTADVVGSLGLEQLLFYIEREFGVAIAGEELARRNFGSVSALAGFIESKQRTAAE